MGKAGFRFGPHYQYCKIYEETKTCDMIFVGGNMDLSKSYIIDYQV